MLTVRSTPVAPAARPSTESRTPAANDVAVSVPTTAPAADSAAAAPASSAAATVSSDIATQTPAGDIARTLNAPVNVQRIVQADPVRLKVVLAHLRENVNITSQSVARLRTIAFLNQEAVSKRDRKHRVEPLKLTPTDSAFAEVRSLEAALRDSIAAAAEASPEAAAAAQSKVAEHYEAYARAVTVAENLARAASRAASHEALVTNTGGY